MQISHRLGTFFLLVGLALLILFVASAMSKDTNGVYLPLSIIALGVGFLLRRNKPVNESGRFRILHQARERSRKRQEEKEKK